MFMAVTVDNRPTRNQSSTGTRSQDYERVGDLSEVIVCVVRLALSSCCYATAGSVDLPS